MDFLKGFIYKEKMKMKLLMKKLLNHLDQKEKSQKEEQYH